MKVYTDIKTEKCNVMRKFIVGVYWVQAALLAGFIVLTYL